MTGQMLSPGRPAWQNFRRLTPLPVHHRLVKQRLVDAAAKNRARGRAGWRCRSRNGSDAARTLKGWALNCSDCDLKSLSSSQYRLLKLGGYSMSNDPPATAGGTDR